MVFDNQGVTTISSVQGIPMQSDLTVPRTRKQAKLSDKTTAILKIQVYH